jgi:hypothetical protein
VTFTTPIINGGGAGECFHKDSLIQFASSDKKLSLTELKSHKACHIPHVVKADGLKFTTSCPNAAALRVTKKHLVFTQRGLVLAESVRVGDFLFQNFEESGSCQVTQIDVEHQQEYFGLNCAIDSIVLADGFKASVFGNYHQVPAMFMKVMSKVMGVEKASNLGDKLASFFHKWI